MTQADQKNSDLKNSHESSINADSSMASGEESYESASEANEFRSPQEGSLEDSFFANAEIDPDQLFEQWAREDARAEELRAQREMERFSVGKQPVVLAIIALISMLLTVYCYPALDAVIHEGEFEQCGNVLERALSQSKGEPLKPFYHQQTCQLSGMVGTTNLFAIGFQETPDAKDEFERNRGVSYVVKLNGDQVYAIIPAHPIEVEGYRLRNGSLFGLEITEVGLMIDPTIATSYRHLERELRTNLGIKSSEEIWFFDVSYSPWDHKMPLATAVIAPLITLLALLAISRELKRRRRFREEEKEEKEWFAAFEAAATSTNDEGEDHQKS